MFLEAFGDELKKLASDNEGKQHHYLRNALLLGAVGYGAHKGIGKLTNMAVDESLGISDVRRRLERIRAKQRVQREMGYPRRPRSSEAGRGRRQREFSNALDEMMSRKEAGIINKLIPSHGILNKLVGRRVPPSVAAAAELAGYEGKMVKLDPHELWRPGVRGSGKRRMAIKAQEKAVAERIKKGE